MRKKLLKNAIIPNLSAKTLDKGDILIDEKGIIAAIGEIEGALSDGALVIDCEGKYALPGFIDLHCHLREPGFEYKETIATGTAAAAAGGYTTVVAMPNTKPAVDSAEVVNYSLSKAEAEGSCTVLTTANITVGAMGEELVDFDALYNAGAVAFTDDGKPVSNPAVMREAMKRCAERNYLIMSHSEELALAEGGAMNEGFTAKKLSVKGIPDSAESVAVAREVLLAEETGCRLHICHVSTEASLNIIRDAKKRGVKVTCETCPHYFFFDDTAVEAYGVNAKMSPPLRSAKCVEAIKEGLADGTIDCISTDHAPHSEEEKNAGLAKAPNGITGIQTAFSAAVTALLNTGFIDIFRLVELTSAKPAAIIGIKSGIRVGNLANICIADIGKKYTLEKSMLKSKSFNTPFIGITLSGTVEHTINNGEIRV